MKLDTIRNEYKLASLCTDDVDDNPIIQFEKWLSEAVESGTHQPTAMSLATMGTDGFPQSRIVLLKFVDENGFVFFTNYNSRKGRSIEKNPAVGLHFFWPELERQVRISGFAHKTGSETAEKYFHSRPTVSQISAWVSEQSKVVPSRKYLDERFVYFSKKFENKQVPLPDFWGGYRVYPVKMEFWQGRENRLHDRILYKKEKEGWKIMRLAP